jgi:hypothetical protein
MWKNTAQPGRPQMTIRRMRLVCLTPKATSIHSEYVLLTAFPLQQWLHECASMLRYTYSACLAFSFPLIMLSASRAPFHSASVEQLTHEIQRNLCHCSHVFEIIKAGISNTQTLFLDF